MPKARSAEQSRTYKGKAVPPKNVVQKAELLKLLDRMQARSYGDDPQDSAALKKAVAKREQLEAELTAFVKNHPTIKRLGREIEAADKAQRTLMNQERRSRSKIIRRLRNQLYIHGATPAVVKQVAAFVEKVERETGE